MEVVGPEDWRISAVKGPTRDMAASWQITRCREKAFKRGNIVQNAFVHCPGGENDSAGQRVSAGAVSWMEGGLGPRTQGRAPCLNSALEFSRPLSHDHRLAFAHMAPRAEH